MGFCHEVHFGFCDLNGNNLGPCSPLIILKTLFSKIHSNAKSTVLRHRSNSKDFSKFHLPFHIVYMNKQCNLECLVNLQAILCCIVSVIP